jgi:hypothetical protein
MKNNAMLFIDAATDIFGAGAILNREQIQKVVDERSVPYPYWFVTKPEYRSGRGSYILPNLNVNSTVQPVQISAATEPMPALAVPQPVSNVHVLKQKKLQDDSDSAVPEEFPGFIAFGFYNEMVKIIRSKQFFPVFITGHSGNGKTLMVEQACAKLKRECIRVNISIETDESDLIGTNTLVDGNIVYRDGPVMIAMKRGSVLLIDEVDRGSNKLLCLQGILEGKPYFNKKSGEYVQPKPGFNIIATANTKGLGSDEGKYLAQILDAAFLERFPITIEQNYPSSKIELEILNQICTDKSFTENLVKWAEVIRKTFNEGAIDEVISTRRLVHIVKAYSIFNNRKKAIEYCVSRYDTDTKNSFIDLYTKVDAEVVVPVSPEITAESVEY